MTLPPADLVHAIGQLLHRTLRQNDRFAQIGEAEFTLATDSINFDAARNFAQRICSAIVNAHLIKDDHAVCLASCGMTLLSEYGANTGSVVLPLKDLRDIACRRAALGLQLGVSGVVGAEEEQAHREGSDVTSIRHRPAALDAPAPDLTTMLQWIRDGKRDLAMRHIEKFSAELQILTDLMQQSTRK
jgi:predicted signal transduction protein with EAL and GGDEF domain